MIPTPQSLLTGTAPRPAVIPLRAGPFTAEFEPDIAFLRHIRLGDHEVVRAIYGAVRNHQWKTVTLGLRNMQIETREKSFHLSFEADCREGDLDFSWRGEIIGDESGRITFTFDGEARTEFPKNRIGLCVLHPIDECAGIEFQFESQDGQRSTAHFPQSIHPFQPFTNIRSITHQVLSGVQSEVRFEGDVFEMEDQRNYSDMSFKIYSTSVKIPFPTQMPRGATVQQKVTITPHTSGRTILPIVQGHQAQLSITTTPGFLKPALGLGVSLHTPPLTPLEIERLRALQLAHLRIDIRLSQPDWKLHLERGLTIISQVGTKLHLGLFFTQNYEHELITLKPELARLRPPVALWLLLHTQARVTPQALTESFHALLTDLALPTSVATGTHGNYVDLTQNPPTTPNNTHPCFHLNPQIHAFDTTTMIENAATPAHMIQSAAAFSSQPAVLSPITLKPFSNAHPSPTEQPPADLDPRQPTLFAAAWTVASLAQLVAVKNIHSLTYFETVGVRGVMESPTGTPWPQHFPSIPESVYPLYHVLADLAGYNQIYPTHSTLPLHLDGLTLVSETGQQRTLLANLLPEPQTISVKTGACRVRVRILDEETLPLALTTPETFRQQLGTTLESTHGKLELTLQPYAIACLDSF